MVGAEAAGVHSLFTGAVLQIRNPLGHREVNLRPNEAYESLFFISYLIRLANEFALERYVYPFLPRTQRARSIQMTKWADLNGDGEDEFLVLMGERDYSATSGGRGRVLVLNHEMNDTLPGELPLTENGFYSAHVALGDIDGDGNTEVLTSFILDGSQWRHGMVIDWDGTSLVGTVALDDSNPLRSFRWPFEIIRPMQHKPGLVVTYDEAGAVRYAGYDAGVLSSNDVHI